MRLRYYRFAGGEGCTEETMGLSALESPGISVNVVDDDTMALLGPSRRATAAIEIMETSSLRRLLAGHTPLWSY